MIRISPLLGFALFAPLLARTTLCSCAPSEPCIYDTIEIDADYETLWDTTVAEDLEWLEQPQVGTWRWGETNERIEIEQSGVERPAIATWVHDGGKRFVEHVDGGVGVGCYGPTVELDGTLIVTDADDDSLIVSLPLTVEYEYTASLTYSAAPTYSPVNDYWPTVHELAEWDQSLVHGAVVWIERERLAAEFYYWVRRMETETTGVGGKSLVGIFEADP